MIVFLTQISEAASRGKLFWTSDFLSDKVEGDVTSMHFFAYAIDPLLILFDEY